MKSQRFIRDFSRIPQPRYASPEIAESVDGNPVDNGMIDVLALSCSISSLNMMIMGLLALASDPQNDNSGIHLPVKPRRLLLHHRDVVVGSTRT
jgi:hypothetical protein